MATTTNRDGDGWPIGCGEMARRIRAFDWAAGPLGPVAAWPQSLRTAVDLLLGSHQPVYVAWGPASVSLYNDGYIPILGARHPAALGAPYAAVWPEIWDESRPLIAATMAGQAQFFEDRPVPLEGRPGFPLSWFTFSWTPLRDETGVVAGFFCTATETTGRVLAEERQAFILRLSDALRPLADPGQVQAMACRMLGEHLEADRAYYVEVNEAGQYARVERDYLRGDSPSLAGVFRLPDQGWIVPHLRRGETVVVADVARDPVVPAAERPAMAAVRIASHVTVPMIKAGELVGALCVTEPAPRGWSAAEVDLVRETAERLWEAIERARAEAALRDGEERYRALVNASSYAVYRMDPDWSRMRVLDGRGFIADTEAPSATWLDAYIDPEDQPRVVAAIREAVDTRGVFDLEHRVRRVDGTLGWTLSRAVPILDANGEVAEWIGAASDVSMRKETEAALRDSEVRLAADLAGMRRLYDLHARLTGETDLRAALGEIVAAANEFLGADRGCIQIVSDDGERLEMVAFRGYDEQDRFIQHVMHEGARPACDAACRDRRLVVEDIASFPALQGTIDREVALGDGIRATQSTPMIGRSGDLVGVLSNQFPEPHRPTDDELRLIDLLAWTAADFVERQQADARLRASAARLRRMINVEGVGVLVFDAAGTLVDANDAFLAMTGHRRVDIDAGRLDWRTLTPPEHVAASEEQMARLGETGRIGPYEKECLRADGSRSWMMFAGAALGDGTVVEYCIDVGDRKRAEAALRESEERFRGFAENSADTLWILDAASGRLEYLSPAFERMWGETRAAVMRDLARWRELVHPDDRERAALVLPTALAGEARVVDYRIVRPADGAVRWIRDTGFPIRDQAGAVRRVAGIAQDVTDQKRVEAVLLASEASSQARAAVATGDLRAVSRRLLTVQEEERRHLARELHDEVGQVLTALQFQLAAADDGNEALTAAAETVRSLTEQVRRMSMDLRPAVLDRYGLLAALRWHADRSEAHTGIRVDLRHDGLARRFPPEVEIGAFRVAQEALTNVSRHSGADAATVRLFAADGVLTVVVRDAGRGFDPALPTNGGLGGLRERIELLGGTLDIEAAPGEGTTLTAEIPFDDTVAGSLAEGWREPEEGAP